MPCETSSSGKYPSFCCQWMSTSTQAYPDSDAHFWDTIFSVDTTSAEVLSNVVTIVYSPAKVNVARSLWGEKAQCFIDLIDRVGDQSKTPNGPSGADHKTQLLTASPNLDQKLFKRCSRLLYKICKARRILPTSYGMKPELTCVGGIGWRGGFADVSKGEHQGRSVAIKDLRIRAKSEFDKIFKVSSCAPLGIYALLISTQRLCREVLVWRYLSHPNILSLLGVSVSENPPYFRIVSEWMPNGSVTEYLRSNPEVNRLHLVSLAIDST